MTFLFLRKGFLLLLLTHPYTKKKWTLFCKHGVVTDTVVLHPQLMRRGCLQRQRWCCCLRMESCVLSLYWTSTQGSNSWPWLLSRCLRTERERLSPVRPQALFKTPIYSRHVLFFTKKLEIPLQQYKHVWPWRSRLAHETIGSIFCLNCSLNNH